MIYYVLSEGYHHLFFETKPSLMELGLFLQIPTTDNVYFLLTMQFQSIAFCFPVTGATQLRLCGAPRECLGGEHPH